MNKKNKKTEWESLLYDLHDFKKELNILLGKTRDFLVEDFERYINIKYRVKFFDSLEEFYRVRRKKSIDGEDIRDYIDCLCYDIVIADYKVTEICDRKGKRSLMIFFNYENNRITKMYLDGDNVGDNSVFEIFEVDGEKKLKEAWEFYYGMTEDEAKELVKQLTE